MRSLSHSLPQRRFDSSKSDSSKSGFALVLALALMGLIVLLLLTLSAISRVAIETTRADSEQLQARQNALLALGKALSQLQKELGPDQRVSATAMILDNPTSSEVGEGSIPGTHYWTAVWEANPEAADYGALRRWLISGETPDPLSPGNTVELVGSRTIDASDPANIVLAPLESFRVSSGLEGGIAYWVGDESSKAKFSITDPGDPNPTLFPKEYGVSFIGPTDDVSDPASFQWIESLSTEDRLRLQSRSAMDHMIQMADRPESAKRKHFHDMTPYGWGVLANSRRGSLRKDLSFGLAPDATEPAGRIFRPQRDSTSTIEDPGGPDWQQYRSWISGVSATGDLEVRPSSADEPGVSPIVALAQVFFLPSYEEGQGGAPDRIHMHLIPSIVLWNPYDRALEETNYTLRIGRRWLGSSFAEILEPMFDHTMPTPFAFHRIRTAYFSNDSAYEKVKSDESVHFAFNLNNVRLEPGEWQRFSLAGNAPFEPSGNPGPNQNELVPVATNAIHGYNFHFPTTVTAHRDDDGNPEKEFRWTQAISRALGMDLNKRTGNTEEILSRTVFINTARESNDHFSPSPDMPDFNPAMPIFDHWESAAVGLRIIKVFSSNEPWGNDFGWIRSGWLTHHNPRASFHGPIPNYYLMGEANYNRHVANNPSYMSFFLPHADWNFSENTLMGSTSAILFDGFSELGKLHSIAQLAHVPISLRDNLSLRNRIHHTRYENLIPAYPVATSQAHPFIPGDQIYYDWGEHNHPEANVFGPGDGLLYDYPFLLNTAFWDEYFFSTIDAGNPSTPNNPRIVPVNNTPSSGYNTSAANYFIDGPFNVNSTSQGAWEALLGSLTQDGKATFPRVPSIVSDPFDGQANSDTAYTGTRMLTPDEVEELAKAIIEEVKKRGPFLSLADFINRDPNSMDDDHQRQGALPSAIDKAQINEVFQTSAFEANDVYLFPNASGGSKVRVTDSIPMNEADYYSSDSTAWLSPLDILTRLGSVLTVRSDTFIIRAYGDISSSAGQVIAAARCEIVVQRMPNYLDPGNPAETPHNPIEAGNNNFDPLVPLNQTFGRTFKIIHFRWLPSQS